LNTITKKFLVVDAWVLGIASGNPISNATWKASEVLSRIIHVCHKVVLDLEEQSTDTILNEYDNQAKSEVTKRWIIALQTKPDKIVSRPRANISLSALSDPDDLKYFQVAANSPHRLIISEDSDMTSIADHPQVTSLRIEIWGLDDALSNL
jgi:predicted nucleic acid-binding protein